MGQSILEIFERSGDANLGQTIQRLAKLAEQVHRYEAAVQIEDYSSWKDQGRVEGIDPPPVVHGSRFGAGPIHTEVI